MGKMNKSSALDGGKRIASYIDGVIVIGNKEVMDYFLAASATLKRHGSVRLLFAQQNATKAILVADKLRELYPVPAEYRELAAKGVSYLTMELELLRTLSQKGHLKLDIYINIYPATTIPKLVGDDFE